MRLSALRRYGAIKVSLSSLLFLFQVLIKEGPQIICLDCLTSPVSDKRIIYDREFLLGFQFSKEKPKDLPDIEPVLMDPHEPTKPLEKGMR